MQRREPRNSTSPSRLATTAAGVLAAASLMIGASPAVAAPADRPEGRAGCAADRAGRIPLEELESGRVDLRDCGQRTVLTDVHGLVELPAPGGSVEVIEHRADGTGRTTRILVAADGQVRVSGPDSSVSSRPAPVVSARPGAACSVFDHDVDAANRWGRDMNYYVRTGVRPSNISASTLVEAVRSAAATIQQGKAPCDGFRSDEVSVRMPYQGTTSAAPCRQDGRNVVAMAYIDGFAKTCNYLDSQHRKSESDVALKVTAPWFQTLYSGCRGRYDLQGVLTHELGHSVGLRGVDGPSLTMSETTTYTCSYWQRSLGAGDVLGLRALY